MLIYIIPYTKYNLIIDFYRQEAFYMKTTRFIKGIGFIVGSAALFAGFISFANASTITASEKESGIISVAEDEQPVDIYAKDGDSFKVVGHKSLSNGDREIILGNTIKDNVKYLEIDTNQFVDSKYIDEENETSSQRLTGVVSTKSNIASQLVTNPLTTNAEAISGRTLAPNTPWYTDTRAIKNGQIFYRVSTHEWVSSHDVTLTSGFTRDSKTLE